MEGPNELYTVMNLYYLGHYQQCINEASKIQVIIEIFEKNKKLNLPETFQSQSVERSIYMYRSYIAQKKYRVVLDEIDVNRTPELKPIRLLAEYFAFPDRKAEIISALEKHEVEADEVSDIWAVASASVFYSEENYSEALRILHQRNDLECLALSLQCLLKINRLDLARKLGETMSKLNDDATLTQLAQAWLNIEVGGEKLNDAYYIFQEFIDKYSASVYLLNGQAVCCIGTEKYEDAERLLRDALDKDSNNYDSLVNFVTLSQLTSKGGANTAQRYIAQIEELYPRSAFVEEQKAKRIEFDRLTHLYRPSVVA